MVQKARDYLKYPLNVPWHFENNRNTSTFFNATVEYTFKGTKVRLNADNGVFSKDRVDFGTNVLLNSLEFDSSSKKY